MTSEEKAGDFTGHRYHHEEEEEEEEKLMHPDNLNSPTDGSTHPETSTTSSSVADDDQQQRYPNENSNTFSESSSFYSSGNNNSAFFSDNSFKNTTANMPSVETSNVDANHANSDTNNDNYRRIFEVLYLGSANIDKRYSSPHFVMPWVMAEVKRKTEGFQEIKLEVRDVSLRGTVISRDDEEEGEFYPDHITSASGHDGSARSFSVTGITGDFCAAPLLCNLQGGQVILFEHKLHGVSRFAKLHQEPRCFAYLTRPQLNSDYHCHVFMAPEENQTVILIMVVIFTTFWPLYSLAFFRCLLFFLTEYDKRHLKKSGESTTAETLNITTTMRITA